MQFATNYLGHFALVLGLHDALAAEGAARIVLVSSSGHLMSPIVFDDIHFMFRPYDPSADTTIRPVTVAFPPFLVSFPNCLPSLVHPVSASGKP